jgi:hypothetical protein
MKEVNLVVCIVMMIILQSICTNLFSADDRIIILQKQISALENQKTQLESQKQALVAKSDDLSYKIESYKMQSKTGLGIIGKYRLSKALREAQSLSEKVQSLEKEIYNVSNEIDNKKNELEKEYESQITILMGGLDKVKSSTERKQTLEKLKSYRAEKEKLAKSGKNELEYLDAAKVEIKQYDNPQDIREKADLINDYTNKLNRNISFLSSKIGELKKERKTRIKLGEFAEEISFFGERVSREEIVSSSDKTEKTTENTPVEVNSVNPTDKSIDRSAVLKNGSLPADSSVATQPESQLPKSTETTTLTGTTVSETRSRMVIERNGVSADYTGSSLEQLEKEIRLLEKKKQDIEKEKATLSKKVKSFYDKANEIEKKGK